MNLLRGMQHVASFEQGVVATIGNFDGVHLGHQSLIKQLRQQADILNLPLVLVLFEPQPKEYFQKEAAPARLSTLREKLMCFRNQDIDFVYCIRFDTQMAQTSAQHFISEYLVKKLNVRFLLVGQDFKFGAQREGTVSVLKDYLSAHQCDVHVASDVCVQQERVSSTAVREALQQGDLAHAARLLGRPFSLCGRVVHGAGRGRLWGIPTANLSVHRFTLPLTGVFVVRVSRQSESILGVANIGRRPTVDGTKNVLEVHLFDFDASLYGEQIQVEFLHKLRNEVKFDSIEHLIEQIHKDIAAAKNYLRKGS